MCMRIPPGHLDSQWLGSWREAITSLNPLVTAHCVLMQQQYFSVFLSDVIYIIAERRNIKEITGDAYLFTHQGGIALFFLNDSLGLIEP